MSKKLNVVIIGGGTGSPKVIEAIKNAGFNLQTLVPMGDSGGSTGRLRDEFGVLSAGELRERLIALASDEKDIKPLKDLLTYRFLAGKDLRGHNLGNILIAGFTEMYGSQARALETLSKLLRVNGEIIPTTYERFELAAKYEDGVKVLGEHNIDEPEAAKKISTLYTEPRVNANPRALEALRQADWIIFSMGDLYTSVLHNIVVGKIANAISESRARKIYVANLMTSFGETTYMSLGELITELEKYIRSPINYAILNSRAIPKKVVEQYKKLHQYPVEMHLKDSQKRIKVVSADLISSKMHRKVKSDILERSALVHDPKKLRKILLKILRKR